MGNRSPILRSLSISGGGRTLLVTTKETLSVGRDPGASIPLTDERASRRHAVIRVEEGAWLYEDLASTNGSYTDGARIARLLIDRERIIRIGNPLTGELIRLTPGPVPDSSAGTSRSVFLWGVAAVLVFVLAVAGAVVSGNLTLSQPSSTIAPTITPTQTTVALTTSDVAAIGKLSTVQIVQGNTLGSGVYLGNDQVLTAAHVIPTTAAILVSFNERSVGAARIVRRDESDDLALLSVPGLQSSGARPITWGDSMVLREGDALVALGYPVGLPLSVKVGVVSGLRVDGGTNLIQTDASLNPGMSGGPVLDSAGRLVGITDFGSARYPGLNFAVASTTARDFVEGRR